MFRKVLIANRGEIARRVMRSCRQLGIETVAVYSDADAGEPHVRDADEAVPVGPAPAAASYLDIDAILAGARRVGAEAIHPGYGFLSENPDFAQACEDAGLVFVGPRPDTIRLMADKAAAKRRLEAAGVPVVPGVHEGLEDLGDDALAAAADRVGYPLLVKAVAGGGGKGMRTVHAPADLLDAVAAARREAAGAFGDDRILLERMVAEPRHVEVQVFGDRHGTVVHLGERECSIQRRHQKIVEETPSPAVDDDLRGRMGAAAVRAAAAVDYLGAGTVEFLLSDVTGEFFFLEMNTRLQVEHPVTELVYGVDLVAWQLRVAAGERLDFAQQDLSARGHALEVRLYAEDAAHQFLPQTGPVHRFVVPTHENVRVDAGVADGSAVTRHYDPMLAKIIVHGPDRAASVARMRWVLEHTAVLGVTTNVEFLAAVVGHPAFGAGSFTTAFLTDHLDGWSPPTAPQELLIAVAVALQHERERARPSRRAGDPFSPWRALGPWRTGQVGGWQLTLREGADIHRLQVAGRAGTYRVTRNDEVVVARVVSRSPDGLQLEVAGHEVAALVVVDGSDVWAHVLGAVRHLEVEPPTRHADATMASGHATFTSPMPGAVIDIGVDEGEHVDAGRTLVVVEAMKMEHPIKAPVPGVVSKLLVAAGDPVDGDAPLLEFDPDAAAAADEPYETEAG